MPPLLRAASYSRVSSRPQETNGSLEEQQSRAQDYALRQGWQYIGDYQDVKSGRLFESREALQQLLADARTGKFDVLIFYNATRAARNSKYYLEMVDRLENQLGVQMVNLAMPLPVVSVEDFDPEDDDGRLVTHQIGALQGELESRAIRRRLTEGRRRKAAQGMYVIATPPYGYCRVVNPFSTETNNRWIKYALEPNPAEYPALELIKHLALEKGYNLYQIAAELERQSYPPQGKMWYSQTVRGILRNPFYAGRIRYVATTRRKQKFIANPDPKKVILAEHNYRPIPFTWEEFERIQEHLKQAGQSTSRQKRSNNPLALLVYCGYCGDRLIFNTGVKSKPYYNCGRYRTNTALCVSTITPTEYLLPIIWQFLDLLAKDLACNPAVFTDRLRLTGAGRAVEELELRRKNLTQKAQKLKERQKRLDDALLDGVVTSSKYRELSETIEADISTNFEEMCSLEDEQAAIQKALGRQANIANALTGWQVLRPKLEKPLKEWEAGEVHECRFYLRTLIKSITVYASRSGSLRFPIYNGEVQIEPAF